MNILDVVRNIFKVNSKDIRTVWDWHCAEVFIVDFEYIQESIWIINKMFFFSFLGMHLSVSSKHLPVQRQQRHLKNKNTKTMSMFLFWCLWACRFSIYFTPFFSVSIVGFQQVSVCWTGTFFCTGITKCINSLCKTIEL